MAGIIEKPNYVFKDLMITKILDIMGNSNFVKKKGGVIEESWWALVQKLYGKIYSKTFAMVAFR